MLRRRTILSIRFHVIPFLSSSFSSSCKKSLFSLPSNLKPPPVPKKIPFTVSAHGETWEDPYHWMSNINDPDLSSYLNQENSYTEAFMADTENLQRRLVTEMKTLMPPRISTPPERWGPWLYYQYVPEGKEYPVLCRRLGCDNGWIKKVFNYMRGSGKEEILLDWNEIAEQFGYVHVGTCRVSPDHKFLAYTLDTIGSELFVLQIKDLRTGCVITKSRVDGVVSLAWSSDSSSLLYTISDETQRPYRVLRTKLGSDAGDDLLFTESDLSCCVDITGTKDGKFITVNSNSRTSSEVYVVDATNPHSGLQCVRKRVPGVQYFLEHHHGFFYLLTNAPSEVMSRVGGDYHLARCSTGNLPLANWQDIILPGQDVIFEDMDMFDGHLVLFLRRRGFPLICSIDMPIDANCKHPMNFEDLNPWFFPLPSRSCSIVPGSNHDFMTDIYRLVLSSPAMPDMIVDYDISNQQFTIVKQEEVIGLTSNIKSSTFTCNAETYLSDLQTDNDKHLQNMKELKTWNDLCEAFSCERREVLSHDGVRVPLTILYSQKAQRNGQSPGLLHGYGAYGEVLDKSWDSDRLSLLNRGWVIAYADVRGGGGGGMSWHHAGTGSYKINSIHDFVACGMYLVNEGYVHKNRLCAIGFSAGGLLVGAAINTHPNLFHAAILKVPFLDTCNTLLDPSLPLTILDYEEFGDPRIQTDFKSIRRYSPYDNIPPNVCHPSMLVTASFNDSRVGVWEAAKWVSKVRENMCPSCSRSVILKTNMSGGHFGEGGRFRKCEEAAFEYAFLMKVLGMRDDDQFEAC
ncbi:prolyl oligopeptidase family protein [Tasmannia lanceolata]|uniref:prolyl oligopeptidase family protein n=1 Tax=Tasmannia lanceolata TaxID=3420 RepID=UPI004062DA7C